MAETQVAHYDGQIYVDGCYNPATRQYGYGMMVVPYPYDANTVEYYKGVFDDEDMAKMNNVAGEIMGARAAFAYMEDHEWLHTQLNYDYQGIAAWCDGSWKSKNANTMNYKGDYEALKEKGYYIYFHHTPAHCGIEGNEICDQLAKDACGIEDAKDEKLHNAKDYHQISINKRLRDYGIIFEHKRQSEVTGQMKSLASADLQPKQEKSEQTIDSPYMKKLIERQYGISVHGGDGVNYTLHYCGGSYKENSGENIERYAKDRGAYHAWGSDYDGLNCDTWVVFDDAQKVPQNLRAFCQQHQDKIDAQRNQIQSVLSKSETIDSQETGKEEAIELPWD